MNLHLPFLVLCELHFVYFFNKLYVAFKFDTELKVNYVRLDFYGFLIEYYDYIRNEKLNQFIKF